MNRLFGLVVMAYTNLVPVEDDVDDDDVVEGLMLAFDVEIVNDCKDMVTV